MPSIDIQAYKIYIKENWHEIEKMGKNELLDKSAWIKDFFINRHEMFPLTRANINKFIACAHNHGQEFKDKDPQDEYKEGPGKRLLEGLNDLEYNSNIENLEFFALLLGLEKIKPFRKNTPLLEKYREMASNHLKGSKRREIVGVYKGYYLDRKFNFGKETPAIRTLLLEILEEGNIQINDGERGHTPHYGSWIFTTQEQIMIINGDFSFDEKSEAPRYHMVLKLASQDNSRKDIDDLEGIVGGYSKTNYPFTTLIKLIKLPYQNIKMAQEQNETIDNFILAKQKREAIKIPKNVIEFFLTASFDSPPSVCIAEEIKSKYLNEDFINIAGLYFFYSTSTNRIGFVCYPVLINLDGKVEIKTKDQIVVEGKVRWYKNKHFLTFDFSHNYSEGPFMGTFLCYADNIKEGEFTTGVSSRINEDLQPQAKREYIYLEDKFEKTNKDQHYLQDKFSKSAFKIFFYNDSTYQKLVETKSDLSLDSLLGREYNLIVETRKIFDKSKIFQRERFDKMYFYQSLIEFLKENKTEPTIVVKNYFKLAMEHGLFLDKRHITYLDEFCKSVSLKPANIVKLKKMSESLYLKFKNVYDPKETM